MVELSMFQRLRLRLFGSVPVGYRVKSGWRGPIMHYAFRCPVHGVVVDYPHGQYESLNSLPPSSIPFYKHGKLQRLECLQCLEEKWKYV